MPMTTVWEAILWFLIIVAADIVAVHYEYSRLKPKSNDSIVRQIEKLSKELAKKTGCKTRAKKIQRVVHELQENEKHDGMA